MKKLKLQCDDCLKLFDKEEIEEIASTGTLLCKKCYEIRKRAFQHLDDPSPFP